MQNSPLRLNDFNFPAIAEYAKKANLAEEWKGLIATPKNIHDFVIFNHIGRVQQGTGNCVTFDNKEILFTFDQS
ncbi:hypothetical protein A9299_07675 [Moraxella osloensis]|uniref:Uncharacterized protein n=1 Tax=Faucicola osloensis TaxID=34062 RepID=A0AA91FJR5_FAUOS|nr:hypothetical protein A9299_07675 [Moraxella osloensis]